MKKLNNAFTLIEILVIIAMIIILTAILYPLFDKAAHNTRRNQPIQSSWRLKPLG